MRILGADIHLIDLETRFPFQYGIATMTRAPHAFVRVRVESSEGIATGLAADVLPPKWFTKVPEKPPADEIDEMLLVIRQAVQSAPGIEGDSAFDLWRELFEAQTAWGRAQGLPPLLANFGATFIERALIEATCKLQETAFAEAVKRNLLGIRLGDLDPQLAGVEPRDLLPPAPRDRIIARHTIGMADALTEDEIPDEKRLHDGLPQSLESCIERYGLRHFKVKVSGDIERDIERIGRIAQVIRRASREKQASRGRKSTGLPENSPFVDRENPQADACGSPGLYDDTFAFTLDGNEQFRTLDAFRTYWQQLTSDKDRRGFFGHLLFVEQPFHRDVALDAGVVGGLKDWPDRPPLIIDESDAELDSMRRALELGYHGTSHKNCKGVFKSILNACILANRRREASRTRQPAGSPDQQAAGLAENPRAHADGSPLIISGEDLANIGPVALLQDMAVAAALGIESVERNGHHYFAGLSMFPPAVQRQVMEHHGDLYHRSAEGWPTLAIRNGMIEVGSINRASLGVGFELDVDEFQSVEQWRADQP